MCEKDRGAVQGHIGVYCNNCRVQCVDCPKDLWHYREDIEYCVSSEEPVCALHVKHCVACVNPLSKAHQLQTALGTGCAECFAVCNSCGGWPIPRTNLELCVRCPPTDGGLHCTTLNHVVHCDVCHDMVCERHGLTLASQQRACRVCAGECKDCHQFFKPVHMTHCYECSGLLCLTDGHVSQFNNSAYCGEHSQTFVQCDGCSRSGSKKDLVICHHCKLAYCPHCTASKSKCKFCDQLRVTPSDQIKSVWLPSSSLNDFKFLDSLAAAHKQQVQMALTEKVQQYTWKCAESEKYQIIEATFSGGFWGFVTRSFAPLKSFVLTFSRKNKNKHIHIRPNQ